MLRGAAARLDREMRLAGWVAWHAAALTRAKKFPPLDKMMPRRRGARPRRQTWEQQKMIAQMLNAAYGGCWRDRKDEA